MLLRKYFGEKPGEFLLHPLNIIFLFIINTSRINLRAGLPVPFHEAIFVFLITLSLSLVFFFSINILIKNSVKTAIILSCTLFFILFFRDINELLVFLKITEILNIFPDKIGELFFVIILMIILLIAAAVFFYKSKRNFIKLNSYLNVLTIIFIVYEIIGLIFLVESKVELKNYVEPASSKNYKEKPDIYFIILDEYTGFEGLKKFWNYDNTGLKNFLINNGFFVAEKGRANYTNTNYSLASTLNMTELNYKKEDVYDVSNYIALAAYIKENSVVKHLYKHGYDFINMSFFDVNNKEKYYQDIYYLKKGNIYQARTIYGHFYEISNEKSADMANINLGIFKKLESISTARSNNPKFVYAHIMMPHPPFYFDAHGNRTSRSYAADKKNMNNYLEQLKYTNRILMQSIKALLNSEKEPVIIIQGDHGYRSYQGKDKRIMEYSILSSFYFPDKDYSLLTDSVKSVNTFRIIFNKYFNYKLDLIK